MTDPDDPANVSAFTSDADRQIKTVVVEVSCGARGEPGFVCADLDAGERTVLSTDPESLRLLGELERSVARNGEEQAAGFPTACTFAALGEASRIHPRFDPWIQEDSQRGERLRLPRPIEGLSMPIGEALRLRRSIRTFPVMDTTELSSLLYYSARVHMAWTAADGFPASSRASPSAGARHPIDLVIIPVAIAGSESARLKCGLPYLFDPMTCELIVIDAVRGNAFRDCTARSGELLGSVPAVLVVMMARPSRTFSRYRGGISLIYRDAGALLATIGLVASSLGLAFCPLASVFPPFVFVEPSLGWVEVGGVALGGVERRETRCD